MRYFIFLFFTIGFISCSKDKTIHEKTATVDTVKKVNRKMYAGNPDLPVNEEEITSIGIGKIILTDSLNGINSLFDSILTISVYSNGIEWPAKKIILENNQWIYAESVSSVNQITSIRTNSDLFRTKSGHRVGLSIDSTLKLQDSIVVDERNKSFLLFNSGVWFKIEPSYENKFFKLKTKDLNQIKQAKISELLIHCEDC